MVDYMTSDAHLRAIAKYQKKTYDMVSVKLRKELGYKEKFTEYADSLDISLSELIVRSLNYVVDHKITP